MKEEPISTEKPAANCLNCGAATAGNFCSRCGQSTSVSRITFRSIADDFSDSLWKINKGLPFTIAALFKRPGQTIRNFIEGKRKPYFKPIAYAITLCTFYFLVAKLLDKPTWIDDLLAGFMAGADDDKVQAPPILIWFSKNYAYGILLLLPVYALGTFIAFKRAKLNYLEHVVLNAYVIGQQALFYSLLPAFSWWHNNDAFTWVTHGLSVLYAFWVHWQFFNKSNRWVNVLATLFAYFLFMFFSIGLLLISLVLTNLIK